MMASTERRPEYASTEVRLLVSPELVGELEETWSRPVQIRVERSETEPTGWTMTARTIGPPTGDLRAIVDQALYLPESELAELAATLNDLVALDKPD